MKPAVEELPDESNSRKKTPRKRLFTGQRLAIALAIFIAFGFGVWGLEHYRQGRSKLLMLQFAKWVLSEVLEKNPVQFKSTGGGAPDWFGDAFAFVSTETPTGQPISIQIYVKSSPFSTKVAYIDFHAAGTTEKQFMKLSTKQLVDVMTKPRGRTIHLPVDAPQRSLPIDLKLLFPEAFAAPDESSKPASR